LVAVPDFGATVSKAVEPEGRVPSVGRAQNADAQVHHRHADTSNSSYGQRPVVEIASFNEQVRETRDFADASELRPERTLDDRRMKTAHGLPLDDRTVSDDVVSRPEQSALHDNVKLTEEPEHAVLRLARIRNDSQHTRTVADYSSPIHHKHVPIQQQLALSRSESA
jgi:hypothetical protein